MCLHFFQSHADLALVHFKSSRSSVTPEAVNGGENMPGTG